MSSEPIVAGMRFHRLVTQKRERRKGKTYWVCKCDCGSVVSVYYYNLKKKNGHTKSCGCWRKDVTTKRNSKHGHSPRGGVSPTYSAWQAMLNRCYSESTVNYHDYGGRGITVCNRWIKSFRYFLADMGERPTSTHSLDRIDNDGPYKPSNCRWATRKEQMRNRRGNRFLTIRGETKTLTEWVELSGIRISVVRDRLKRGWTEEAAVFETPVHSGRKNKKATKVYTHAGVTYDPNKDKRESRNKRNVK